MSGAARQRLDADCARPGADVGETRSFDPRRQDVEDRLAQTIRSRAYAQPFERFQAATLVDSGDDSHDRWRRGDVATWRRGEMEYRLLVALSPSRPVAPSLFFVSIRMRQTPAPGGFNDIVEFAVARVPAQVAHDLV